MYRRAKQSYDIELPELLQHTDRHLRRITLGLYADMLPPHTQHDARPVNYGMCETSASAEVESGGERCVEVVGGGRKSESTDKHGGIPTGGHNKEEGHQTVEQIQPVAPRVVVRVVGWCDDRKFPFYG